MNFILWSSCFWVWFQMHRFCDCSPPLFLWMNISTALDPDVYKLLWDMINYYKLWHLKTNLISVSEPPPTINSTSSSVSKDSNFTCNSSSCMTLQDDQLININNIPQDTVINKLPGKIVSSDHGTHLNSILEKG